MKNLFPLMGLIILLAACTTQPTPGAEQPASDESTAENPVPDIELVAEGFDSPNGLTTDGSGRLFVTEQLGTISIIAEDGSVLPEPFLDVSGQMVSLAAQYDERGLLGLAFHPDYADNGRFFVYYSAPLRAGAPAGTDHTSILAEYQVSADDPNRADPTSAQTIMTIDQPYGNHNGGQLAFGPDGYLYLGLGDGGSGGDPESNGQNPSTLLGTILRIDVNSGEGYVIPADNPFAAGEGGAPEVFAYGFRNPYRFSFDGELGLIAPDVGQNAFEEVNVVEMGGNYGWKIREATHCYSPPSDCPQVGPQGEDLLPPVLEYDHDLGLSVIGGYVYRGETLPDLQGRYIFGDWSSTFATGRGQVFVATPQPEGMWSFEPLVFASTGDNTLGSLFVMGFGQSQNGDIYIITDSKRGPRPGGGQIFRLTAAN